MKRHIVRQGQKMLNDGRPMVEVIKELQVTEATLVQVAEPIRVREKRRGVQTDQGAREGKRRLKRLLAEKELAIDVVVRPAALERPISWQQPRHVSHAAPTFPYALTLSAFYES